jgi:cobalt-zinc-cadmium efflux system outer membrane protein
MPGATRAQTPPATASLTLDAALARARESNPTLVAARLARPAAAAAVGVARERPNPEVSYEASRETPRQSLGVVLPIELGGKRQRRIDLADAGVAAADADLAAVTATIEDDVRRAYLALAGAEARASLARASRDLAARARAAADARLTAGDAPRLDLTQAEIALLDADNAVTAADAERTAACIELDTLLGLPPDAALVVAAAAASARPLPPAAALVAAARQSNAALVALDRRIDEQAAQRKLALAMTVPDISVGSALTYDAEPEFRAGWRLSFAAAVPLFTRRDTHVRVEDATLARLRAERDAAGASVAGAVAASLARASALRERLARYDADILPRVADLERMAQDAYASGQSNLAALLQALQSARDVRAGAVDAGVDYQTALADLERAVGGPLPQ